MTSQRADPLTPAAILVDQHLDHALGVWRLSAGMYDAAMTPLLRAVRQSSDRESVNSPVPDLVEAAVRSGRAHLAVEPVSRFRAWALHDGSQYALGLLDRASALLVEDGDAECLYRRSVGHLKSADEPFAIARTQLLLGEWLRRRRRRREASEQLRSALDAFERGPSDAFVTRAQREFLATHEDQLRRTDDADGLTARERQVAVEAAHGRTNREIGGQLYISPQTVGYHLRNVYRKLSIRSRRQLFGALTQIYREPTIDGSDRSRSRSWA